MDFTCKQAFLSKSRQQTQFSMSTRCHCFTCLVVIVTFLVGSASSNCVSQPSDRRCPSNQFYDHANSCCKQCTGCSDSEEEIYPCNSTHNAMCVIRCTNPEILRWSQNDGACVIRDCSKCPGGGCLEFNAEACRCDACHQGPICNIPVNSVNCRSDVSNPNDRSATSQGGSLNPLSIGLIAIGVVIGIVAFSSCFLLFGVCTTKQRRASGDNQSSENSESGLVSGRGFSNSTRSSYMSGVSGTTAFLNNQSMLELLRHSSTPIHSVGSSSSIRSSPKSIRSSPRFVRTSPLVPSSPATDKLRESGIITSV